MKSKKRKQRLDKGRKRKSYNQAESETVSAEVPNNWWEWEFPANNRFVPWSKLLKLMKPKKTTQSTLKKVMTKNGRVILSRGCRVALG
jgi:hypothetical protein